MCVGPVADSLSSRTIPFHSFLSGGLFSPPVHSPTDPQHFLILARSICPLSPSLSAWLLPAVHPPPRYFAHYPSLLSPSRPLSWRLCTQRSDRLSLRWWRRWFSGMAVRTPSFTAASPRPLLSLLATGRDPGLDTFYSDGCSGSSAFVTYWLLFHLSQEDYYYYYVLLESASFTLKMLKHQYQSIFIIFRACHKVTFRK